MLNVRIKTEDYPLKQNPSEFTIGEYEKISSIINNDELDQIDKYSQFFVELGIPQDVMDDLNTIEFFNIIKSYTSDKFELGEFQQTIEINGRTYKAFNEEFFLNVKDMKAIEKYVKINPNSFVGELMAIVFKDVDLTKTEHYADAHIRHKAKLFREHVTFDVAVPYVGYFSKELLGSLEMFKETIESNEN